MVKAVIFLCQQAEIIRERKGYADAFVENGIEVIVKNDNSSMQDFIHGHRHFDILAIIRPEAPSSLLPYDLFDIEIPVVNFDFDTYRLSKIRAKAARLFDFQIVCHPGYKGLFKSYGCSFPVFLPWCADYNLARNRGENMREYEIGWVGRSDAPFYQERRKILSLLSGRYHLNDYSQQYDWHQMYDIYRQAKLVVNVSRDDYPQDANMRCFEVMGAGSLLLTKVPTDLTELGFEDTIHFVGYRDHQDLIGKVDYYLENEADREDIATKGREMVLEHHTYRARVSHLLEVIRKNGESVVQQRGSRTDLMQFAYVNWRDGKMDQMIESMSRSDTGPSFQVLFLLVKLFLQKVVRLLRH